MTNYREILRLHSLGLNKTESASSCQCARNTVAATLQRAANCGLQWPLPEEMSDKQLSERLFPSSTSKPVYKMPDYASVHKELQRSGVTLNLLWAVAGILRPVPGGGRDSIPINPVQQVLCRLSGKGQRYHAPEPQTR